jgi:hypothetical protein
MSNMGEMYIRFLSDNAPYETNINMFMEGIIWQIGH